eukprot:jgi/Botrbrau1/15579/Bobra.33_1s0008.1
MGFLDLPEDLMLRISDKLPDAEDINALRLTCRAWRKILPAEGPAFSKEIDFPNHPFMSVPSCRLSIVRKFLSLLWHKVQCGSRH